MSDYEQSLFNSYTWGGERKDIVNEINETIKRRGTPRFRYLSRWVEIKDKYSSQIQFNS